MREEEKQSRERAKELRQQMPRAEVILWSWLRKGGAQGHKFRRQHPIGPYNADFACVKDRLVVEVDGATHWTEEQREHDRRRAAFMAAKGWRTIRVTNADVYTNLDGVARLILANLSKTDGE